MTGTTHRLGGILVGMGMIELLQADDIKQQGLILGAAILGSLIPDIDNPQSTISYKIPLLRSLVGMLQGAVRLFSCILPKKQKQYVRSCIGHRGITHSWIFVVILMLLTLLADRILQPEMNLILIGAATSAGMISHIVLDCFANGVPLLLPFSTNRVTITHIKTGGAAEWFVRAGLILLIGVFCYYQGGFSL